MHIYDFLKEALATNHYDLQESIQRQFIRYLELLEQWNRVFNLTAIRTPHDMVMLHLLDSLSISPFIQGHRILDVGTGAGFPGIPLALTHPDHEFILLDSNRKKTQFLTHVKHTLNISNVEIIHHRAENFHPITGFDSIVFRAVSSIQSLITITDHLLKNDGQWLMMKGEYPDDEIAAVSKSFFIDVHPLTIQGLQAKRHIVCVKKDKP